MKQKKQIKKGTKIIVIAGAHKGDSGKIIEVIPGKQRIRVENVNLKKRHMKPKQGSAEGSIVELEGAIHVSNVMVTEHYDFKKKGAGE